MQEIPKPQALDPDRPLRRRGTAFTEDDRPEAELLSKALHESCAYADQLWEHLNGIRQYLVDSLPSDPRTPGPGLRASASPTGPDDETGWEKWIETFSAVTSVLCGSHGDSGFGLHEARELAQLRRSAPNLALASTVKQGAAESEPANPGRAHTTPGAAVASATAPAVRRPAGPATRASQASAAEATPGDDPPPSSQSWQRAHSVLTAVLAVLAVRGIRSGRARTAGAPR